jgi:HEPN domain-containing protein
MNEKSKQYILNWIKKAEHDIMNARIIIEHYSSMNDAPFDTACFHCQQAVEKYLKAALLYFNIPIQKSHNLGSLVYLCIEKNPNFEAIMEKAETLTPFAVEIRYPDDFYLPTQTEAEEALATAIEIKNFILSYFPEEWELK